MAHLRLDFVHSFRDRHGKRRHYFRRRGFKNAPLPGQIGSTEFMTAYRRALAGETVPIFDMSCSSKPGSVSAAIEAYLGSIDFGGLAPSTQRDRRAILDRFRKEAGEKPFATLTRAIVDRWLVEKVSTPQAAKSFLKALRAVIKTAMRIGLRADDPTTGIRIKTRDHGGWRTWTEDEIAQFEAAYPIGTRERLAFALLLFTGQRRGDVIRMGRQHVKGGFLTVRQGKTGATVAIPIHPALQAASDARQMTFLTTATGRPFAPGAFTNWFGAAVRAAGLPLGLSAHGLRKAMCRRLAEAGCSANQIAAISGHVTLKEVERYTKAADQRRMAMAAMEQIEILSGNLSARVANPLSKSLKLKKD